VPHSAQSLWRNSWPRVNSRPAERELAPECEPPLGAHMVTPRLGYTHHGIYEGCGRVVQYGGLSRGLRRGPVEEVSLLEFCRGRSIRIRSHEPCWRDAQEVVRRARLRLGENRYHLLRNNCEHFCEWCVHGEHRSYQVEKLIGRCASVCHQLVESVVRALALRGPGRPRLRPQRLICLMPTTTPQWFKSPVTIGRSEAMNIDRKQLRSFSVIGFILTAAALAACNGNHSTGAASNSPPYNTIGALSNNVELARTTAANGDSSPRFITTPPPSFTGIKATTGPQTVLRPGGMLLVHEQWYVDYVLHAFSRADVSAAEGTDFPNNLGIIDNGGGVTFSPSVDAVVGPWVSSLPGDDLLLTPNIGKCQVAQF